MKILYEGVDIYPDISVHRCYHDMYAEKQSDELLLKLNDTRELWDSWNPKKGDTIAIEDGAAKTGKCSSRASSPSPASSPCGPIPSRSLRRISGANRGKRSSSCNWLRRSPAATA